MKKLLLLLLLPISIFAQTNTLSEKSLKYANSITEGDLKEYLYVLASDSMKGRETGAIGQRKAAKYIAKFFKERVAYIYKGEGEKDIKKTDISVGNKEARDAKSLNASVLILKKK